MLNDEMLAFAGLDLVLHDPVQDQAIERYDNPDLFVQYYRCPWDGTCWADFWLGTSVCNCPACGRQVDSYWPWRAAA